MLHDGDILHGQRNCNVLSMLYTILCVNECVII